MENNSRSFRNEGETNQSPGTNLEYFRSVDLYRTCSIVLQDKKLELESQPEKIDKALSTSYAQLKNVSAQLQRSNTSFEHTHDGTEFKRGESISELRQKLLADITLRSYPQRLENADLFDNFSPFQKQRQCWKPTLPAVYRQNTFCLNPTDAPELVKHDEDELRLLHPGIYDQPCVTIELPSAEQLTRTVSFNISRRYGVVLSGGPAPGGHNAIAGLIDYLKSLHPENTLLGFQGGLTGLLKNNYRIITDETMHRFRNQGGFDMLCSGRGRIQGAKDVLAAAQTCFDNQLDGLVIIGGDGSLSNATLCAEFFSSHLPQCSVVGIPKTIDGDLKNAWIETSFGFDTAAKTYSELIGNLCTDVLTGHQIYHFIRVMGRSASHLVVECALQTHPNLVLIGEEIEAEKRSLKSIVNSLVDLIQKRFEIGKSFGIILVPEGLIEFIPEIKALIDDVNVLLKNHKLDAISLDDVKSNLAERSQPVWDFLPKAIKEQLLFDRESTGYIQVGRIATERLLKVLVETEIENRKLKMKDLFIMPHYFGYEGRCAMPSNFDSNYCYALGYTAGVLLTHKKSGYVSVIRNLKEHPSKWIPGGIPLTRIMEMKTNQEGKRFPAVIRQMFDLKNPLYKLLQDVREEWALHEHYRVPGPIQFDGPGADSVNLTIAIPPRDALIKKFRCADSFKDNEEAVTHAIDQMSELQQERLNYIPSIPSLSCDPQARAIEGTQYISKNPFTQRQIILNYPHLCNNNKFLLHEVVHDPDKKAEKGHLRIGVAFLSRQAPGVLNVLWGIAERLQIIGGCCFGFHGADGLFQGEYTEITVDTMRAHRNQGGMELLGQRSGRNRLLTQEYTEKARLTCINMKLDGLILVGSSLSMTEAAWTAEYFLAKQCPTCVIGIPVTASNNLVNELIETNLGFDSANKVYASLIGNVLADAASMPKYWHFVRLMGRQPSHGVLECALQTHPNVVIISEEYGIGNKTLKDVVNDIADVVCKRSDMGKNFGSVLIPDSLLVHLPNMKLLMNELDQLFYACRSTGSLENLCKELDSISVDGYDSSIDILPGKGGEKLQNPRFEWISKITPWSLALFNSLPSYIRKELARPDLHEMRFSVIETEVLLSELVDQELKHRKETGKFKGQFAAVCHFFGYQGRSSMPSNFDCKLGFAYGHLATILVESHLTGYVCTIRNLCGDTKDWKMAAIPLNSMLQIVLQPDDLYIELRSKPKELPIIPIAEVNLDSNAYRWMKTAVTSQWQLQDRFCNPGPIQFTGSASMFYHRSLHEEQAQYYNMLRLTQVYAHLLQNACSFGVDEQFLKIVYTTLHSLLTYYYHRDDLMSFTSPLIDQSLLEEFLSCGQSLHKVKSLTQMIRHPHSKASRTPPVQSVATVQKRPSLIGMISSCPP